MTGTGLAQAIPIAVSPILTRIYSPEDFGKFALYLSIVSILSIVVTGRYELAISLPKKERDAFNILILSILLTTALSFILLLIILIYKTEIIKIIGGEKISDWIYWIPISTFLSGVLSNLNYWNNRKEYYKNLAISRVAQSSSGAVTQLSMGLINSGAQGMLFGQMFGQVVSIYFLIKNKYMIEMLGIIKINWNNILHISLEYKDFPRIMIIAHGFNAASSQMPVILLSTLFNATTAGYYLLIQRVMGMPMTLISSAFGDIFRQEASKAYVSTGDCRVIFKQTFMRLFLFAILPFSIFFFTAPDIFMLIFGEEWKIAGDYARILTPMFFLQFVTSPLSSVFMIAQKQKIDLFWQITLLSLVVFALMLGAGIDSVTTSLVLFSISYCSMYILNVVIAYRLAKNNDWRNE